MKSVLWRVAKRLSCIQDARCLKVKYSSLFSETLEGLRLKGFEPKSIPENEVH